MLPAFLTAFPAGSAKPLWSLHRFCSRRPRLCRSAESKAATKCRFTRLPIILWFEGSVHTSCLSTCRGKHKIHVSTWNHKILQTDETFNRIKQHQTGRLLRSSASSIVLEEHLYEIAIWKCFEGLNEWVKLFLKLLKLIFSSESVLCEQLLQSQDVKHLNLLIITALKPFVFLLDPVKLLLFKAALIPTGHQEAAAASQMVWLLWFWSLLINCLFSCYGYRETVSLLFSGQMQQVQWHLAIYKSGSFQNKISGLYILNSVFLTCAKPYDFSTPR